MRYPQPVEPQSGRCKVLAINLAILELLIDLPTNNSRESLLQDSSIKVKIGIFGTAKMTQNWYERDHTWAGF